MFWLRRAVPRWLTQLQHRWYTSDHSPLVIARKAECLTRRALLRLRPGRKSALWAERERLLCLEDPTPSENLRLGQIERALGRTSVYGKGPVSIREWAEFSVQAEDFLASLGEVRE